MQISKTRARLIIIMLMLTPAVVNTAADVFLHDQSTKVTLSFVMLIVAVAVAGLLVANEARQG
jgi:ABC-type glucose/galactose transport system permease subunit